MAVMGALLLLLTLLTLTLLLLAAERDDTTTPLPFASSSSPSSSPSSSTSPCSTDPLSREADPRRVALYFTAGSRPVTEVTSRFLEVPDPGTCSQPLDLLVLVPSPPGAASVRAAVRDTWGSVVREGWPGLSRGGSPSNARRRKVGLVFVLGRPPPPPPPPPPPAAQLTTEGGWFFNSSAATYTTTTTEAAASTALKEEASQHGDLLVGDFLDTYRNLTRKMLAGLQWVSLHCPRAAYVLKADQDTFVHVDRLLEAVEELERSQPGVTTRAVLGEVLCAESVSRDRQSPVFVHPDTYPFSVYPPYARGGSYVLGGGVVGELVNASRYLPYLPVEDAFINGVVARALGLRHLHVRRVMQGLAPCPLTPCLFLAAGQLTATNVGPQLMRDVWAAVRAGPDHCRRRASLWTRACVWAASHWS